MKNSKLAKIFLVILLGAVLIFSATQVLAEDSYNDLSSALNETTNNTAGNNTSNLTGNTANNTLNTSGLTNTANNSSSYNNTSLPSTGIESSVPMIAFMVILAISAVYAYKKVNDYKNI